MDSRKFGPLIFSTGIAIRAVAVAGLAFLTIWLATRELFANALVVCGIAALVTTDLWRAVTRIDRLLEQFLNSSLAGDYISPFRKRYGFERLKSALKDITYKLSAGRAEREVRIGYLQALLDTVSAALIIVNSEGRVTPANNAGRRLASNSVDRLEDIALFDSAVVEALRNLPPGARKVVALADGRQMFVSAARFSVPGQTADRLVAFQGLAQELDVVEIKAWQDMARVLSHEMMNSLTPISSLSESLSALIHGEDSGELTGAIESIKRRSVGLIDFVERYRKVAELPALNIETIRVSDFVDGVQRLMSASFKERTISFESNVLSPSLSFRADPALLEQAIINFLHNAMDAVSASQNPMVTISSWVDDGRIVFAVADNGCGLPLTDPEQIFVPFFTTKSNGSGIGLTLARQIAIAHGGRVEAVRNFPSGAIFKLLLPI